MCRADVVLGLEVVPLLTRFLGAPVPDAGAGKGGGGQACSVAAWGGLVAGRAVRGGGGGVLALAEGGGWATLIVPGVIYYSPLQAGMYRSRRDVVRSVQSTIPRPRPGTPRCPPIAQGNARPPNSTPHAPPYTTHKGTT